LIHTIVLLQSVRQCVSQQEAAELLATAADSIASTTSATVASEASAAEALLHEMRGTDDDETVAQPLPVNLSRTKLPEVKQLLKYAVLHRSLELADNYFINRYKLQVLALIPHRAGCKLTIVRV
jgi:hypothetical protein